MRLGNPNVLMAPRNWRRAALLTGALLTGACSRTYQGGGVISNTCIRGQMELEMKKGDSVYLGVGDIEFNGGGRTIKDALTLTVEDDHLKVDSQDDSGEHTIVTPGSEPRQLRFQAEENRANVHVSVSPLSAGVLSVHIDKTCPGQ